ncbi:hypothetical protein LCGC14_2328080 [marine sediment metagenome]|uniref:Uncharacterized protein n=1 Tax=marine sediment metagenome TaxID=412755 RepID=A0A0F9D378_9ZZZZ
MMTEVEETTAALEAIKAMVDAICEVTEEAELGFSVEGEIYAHLMVALPNMTPMEFRRLKLLALATGRVEQGPNHTLVPVR